MQTFELSDKQKELRKIAGSPARHVLAFGGSRSGKTFGFCYCTATRALMAEGSRHLIGRLHNVDVRQAVMMDTWPAMMRLAYPNVPYTLNKSDQFATFPNKAEVWFAGFDDSDRIEKILGKEYATIYTSEASQIPYQTITTVRTRLAQNVVKSNGKRLMLKSYTDLNPVGKSHWTYREFVQGVRPDNPEIKLDANRFAHIVINPTDNPNLAPEYLEELAALPERQRQRYLEGNYQSEVPGSLWPTERIDSTRVTAIPAGVTIERIVIGVDPSGSDGAGGDSQGIVVVGLGSDGHGYLLEDATCRLSPAGWGGVIADLWDKWGADKVVAERNFGGAMVESTIRTVNDRINVEMVTASRGKHIRAEPVSALYESRPDLPARMHHVGYYPDLEDQMSMFTTAGYQGSGSPDRADALVWAVIELMLGGSEEQAAMILKKRHRK